MVATVTLLFGLYFDFRFRYLFILFETTASKKTAFGCIAFDGGDTFTSYPKSELSLPSWLIIDVSFFFYYENLFISCLISNLFFLLSLDSSFFSGFDLMDYLGKRHLGTASFCTTYRIYFSLSISKKYRQTDEISQLAFYLSN